MTYTYNNPAVTYGIGRLTKVSNEISTTNILAYDALGRVAASQQVTAGQTYNLGYTWDLAGGLTSERYPSGRSIQSTYDGANRASQVTGVWDQQAKTYLSGVKYAPHGQPNWFLYGNNLCRAFTYNNRLQPVGSIDSEQPNPPGSATDCTNPADEHLVLNWAWGLSATQNNGNLREMDAWHGGPGYPQFLAFSETFQYDNVNRLVSASDSGGWSRQFSYDQYGNLWVPNGTGVPISAQTPSSGNFIDPSTNRVGGATGYDAAGNQTRALNSSQVSTFDTENHLSQVVDTAVPGGQVSYIYDGNGQRVQKVFSDGGTETYVYDILGRLAAEYSSNPTTSAAPCKTCYLSTDHLGSTRLVTGDNGAIIARHDYLPFGEEVLAGYASRQSEWGGADRVNQKFTGKERDAESGLDYMEARYYGSSMGRMMSPDPVFISIDRIRDPQGLNLYAYARNNPPSITDPTGLDFYQTCTSTKDNGDTCRQVQNGSSKVWVQGTSDSNGFTANRIANDADGNLVDPAHGNAAVSGTFDESGVHLNGSQGQFIDGSAQTNIKVKGVSSQWSIFQPKQPFAFTVFFENLQAAKLQKRLAFPRQPPAPVLIRPVP